jgi:hypothetical protein
MGFKWLTFPLVLTKNQPGKMREKRYSKNAFAYIKRLVNNRIDKVRALGLSNFNQINSKSSVEKIFEYMAMITCNIKGLEVFPYSNSPYNNWDYVAMNSSFLNPDITGIDRSYWGNLTYRYLFKKEVLQLQIKKLADIGLNKVYEFKNGFLLVTTPEISTKIIDMVGKLTL